MQQRPSQCHRPLDAPAEPAEDLGHVRVAIDEIDDALLSLMRERLELAVVAARSKQRTGRPQRDARREAQIVRRASLRARELGMDDTTVRAVFWRLIDLSHQRVAAIEVAR